MPGEPRHHIPGRGIENDVATIFRPAAVIVYVLVDPLYFLDK